MPIPSLLARNAHTATAAARRRRPALTRRGTVLASAITLVLLTACNGPAEEARKNEPLPVVRGETVEFPGRVQGLRTETAEALDAQALSLPGRLAWNEDRTVRVMSPYAGRVLRTLVNVGDTVKAGQPLAELASGDFEQAQADARRAAADLRLAQQNLERAQELTQAGIMARKELQQSQAEFDRATAEEARARNRLSHAGGGTGGNFVLRAPIGGVVVDKALNPGQELRPDGQAGPLFVLTDPGQLWAWIDAPEPELPRILPVPLGTGLTITSAAWPDKTFTGRLTQKADFIDPSARTYRLRGAIDNPGRLLKGEMFVNATFNLPATRAASDQVAVPSAAVLFENGRNFIIVQQDAKQFVRQAITVVREHAGRSVIAGLGAGSKVVVEGNLYLQQLLQVAARSAAVSTAPAPAPAAAPAPANPPAANPPATPAAPAAPTTGTPRS